MKKNEKKPLSRGARLFNKGMHPGAYVNERDVDQDLLEYCELIDAVDFIDPESRKKILEEEEKNSANSASPPATDPPVPNRAHTEM